MAESALTGGNGQKKVPSNSRGCTVESDTQQVSPVLCCKPWMLQLQRPSCQGAQRMEPNTLGTEVQGWSRPGNTGNWLGFLQTDIGKLRCAQGWDSGQELIPSASSREWAESSWFLLEIVEDMAPSWPFLSPVPVTGLRTSSQALAASTFENLVNQERIIKESLLGTIYSTPRMNSSEESHPTDGAHN